MAGLCEGEATLAPYRVVKHKWYRKKNLIVKNYHFL